MRKSNFEILTVTPTHVVLQDLGPWDQHPTITNDAEAVVGCFVRGFGGVQLGARRLYYLDSERELTELLIHDGKFAGFGPGRLPQATVASKPQCPTCGAFVPTIFEHVDGCPEDADDDSPESRQAHANDRDGFTAQDEYDADRRRNGL